MSDQWDIRFIGAGRKAQNPPNAEYPDGIDLDISEGKPSCSTPIPYPAPEVGKWLVHCKTCDNLSMITAAGRPDDPRSMTIPCKLKVQ